MTNEESAEQRFERVMKKYLELRLDNETTVRLLTTIEAMAIQPDFRGMIEELVKANLSPEDLGMAQQSIMDEMVFRSHMMNLKYPMGSLFGLN